MLSTCYLAITLPHYKDLESTANSTSLPHRPNAGKVANPSHTALLANLLPYGGHLVACLKAVMFITRYIAASSKRATVSTLTTSRPRGLQQPHHCDQNHTIITQTPQHSTTAGGNTDLKHNQERAINTQPAKAGPWMHRHP